MDVVKVKEEIKFDQEGDVYTLQIKDFHNKMKTWESGKYIENNVSSCRMLNLFLRIYPNGDEAGHVSVYLRNATKKQVCTNFKIRIGQQVESSFHDHVNSQFGKGWSISLQHSSLVNQEQKGDEQLEVVCTIMNINHLDTIENNNKYRTRLNDKLAQLEAKSDEPDKGRKKKKPTCPICFEDMSSSDTRIAQCISGHLICWSCKEKMVKNDCPSCGQSVNGRAFGMESYLKYLFQD